MIIDTVLTRSRSARTGLRWAVALSALAVAMPAMAQDTAGAPSQPGSDGEASSTSLGSDTIIVTARKREEILQDIPVAVAALSGEALEEVGISRLDQVTALVPNLRIQASGTGASVATVYIRGIGYNGTEKLDSPSVGVFIDDFYWGMGHGQLIDTFDIERLEVLRGPQSVLFGKNTSGGAIVVRRTQPEGELSGKVKVGLGNYGQKNFQAVLHTPSSMNDTLAAKLYVNYKDRKGFADNLYDGTDEGENTYVGVGGSLKWTPTPELTALAIFDYISERGEATPLQNANLVGESTLLAPLLGGNRLNPGIRAHEVWPDLQSDQKLDAYRYSLRLDWETPIGTVTSITGYLDEADITLQDFDSGCGQDSQGLGCTFAVNPLLVSPPNPNGTLHTIRDQEFQEFTQELRIASQIKDWMFFQGGVFYYDDSIESRQTTNFAAFERSTQDTRSYAVFGQLEFNVTPDLRVSGGAQYIDERKKHTKTVFFLPDVPVVGGLVTLPLISNERSWDDVVYQAAITWEPSPNHTLYASMSDGFRSGGFSARGTAVEAVDPTLPNYTGGTGENYLAFEPETTRQFEIGSKNRLFDGALTLNLTAYRTRLKGLQQGAVTLTPFSGVNTNTYINNFQLAEYKGFEIESVLRVPGIEGLTLLANFGYLDAEVKEAVVPAVRLGVGPGGLPGSPAQGLIDLSTTPLVQAPEYTYALTSNYVREISQDVTLDATVQYAYTDDVVLTSLGPFVDTQKGYGLLDASIGLRWQNMRFQLTGKNLTNEVHRQTALINVLFQSFGNPRTFLGEFTVEF